MKKTFLIFIFFVITLFNYNVIGQTKPTSKSSSTLSQKQKTSEATKGVNTNLPLSKKTDSALFTIAKKVLTALRNKNYNQFASFIHPVLGVRISPQTFVDPEMDLHFKVDKFLAAIKNAQYKIPIYDGDDSTVLLTLEGYFKEYVYNIDYLNEGKLTIFTLPGYDGNSWNNINDVYKECVYVECNYPGTSGYDRASLILIYKKYNNQFYLVGTTHDQWEP